MTDWIATRKQIWKFDKFSVKDRKEDIPTTKVVTNISNQDLAKATSVLKKGHQMITKVCFVVAPTEEIVCSVEADGSGRNNTTGYISHIKDDQATKT